VQLNDLKKDAISKFATISNSILQHGKNTLW
jgi:hypothetical protein